MTTHDTAQPSPPPAERYLGDGVYASCDGYQIWLRTPREYGDHRIALEPEVFRALVKFERELRTEAEGVRDGTVVRPL